jgi:DNA-binding transcriptional regulator YiaG
MSGFMITGKGELTQNPVTVNAADAQCKRLSRVTRVMIKAVRKDADMSQQELAQRLEWTRNQVANIEGGRRMIGLVDFILVARALRVEPDRLLQRILRW